MKAQMKVTYNPDQVEFWRDNWTLAKLVQILAVRDTIKPGDNLRVILVKDRGQETLFLQGNEVIVVKDLLEYLNERAQASGVESDDVVYSTVRDILGRLNASARSS